MMHVQTQQMKAKRLKLWITGLFWLLTLCTSEPMKVTTSSTTHMTRHSFYDPTVLKLQNQLVYVSYPKINADVMISLEYAAMTNGLDNCSVAVKVPADRDFLGPEARVLGNGKLLVGLVETTDAPEPRLSIRFYIIDPDNRCAHSNFSVAFDDEMLQYYRPFSVLPYLDSFDVFVKSYSHCTPPGSICLVRFDLKGKHLQTLNFDFATKDSSYELATIYPLIEFDLSSGYVYVNREDSSLKVLDCKAKTLRQKRLSGYIRAHSVLNTDIGVCYHEEPEADEDLPRTRCQKLDSRLKAKASYSLSNSVQYPTRRLYNLADGSSLLLSIARGELDLSVRRLGLNGKVSAAQTYSFDCQSIFTEPVDRFVELKGRVYCYSFVCKFKMITHCVPLPEAPSLDAFP